MEVARARLMRPTLDADKGNAVALRSHRLRIVIFALLAALALAGCTTTGQTGASKPVVGAEATTGGSTTEATAAAGETKSSLLDPSGNVVLFVDNGSIPGESNDIVVEIDGEVVVDRVFPSARDSNVQPSPDQGYYLLALPSGPHTIRVRSDSGRASQVKSFEVDDKLWIAVAYSYNTARYGTPEPRQFNIVISEKEMGRL